MGGGLSSVLEDMEGVHGCRRLRVLNLSNNRIRDPQCMGLCGLIELNLRRNCIAQLGDLTALVKLQKFYLSFNAIAQLEALESLFCLQQLLELTLDNNPALACGPQLVCVWIATHLPLLRLLNNAEVLPTDRDPTLLDRTQLELRLSKASAVVSGSVVLHGEEKMHEFVKAEWGTCIEASTLEAVDKVVLVRFLQPLHAITQSLQTLELIENDICTFSDFLLFRRFESPATLCVSPRC